MLGLEEILTGTFVGVPDGEPGPPKAPSSSSKSSFEPPLLLSPSSSSSYFVGEKEMEGYDDREGVNEVM